MGSEVGISAEILVWRAEASSSVWAARDSWAFSASRVRERPSMLAALRVSDASDSSSENMFLDCA